MKKKMTKTTTNPWRKYPKAVQDYMANVIACLQEDYGKIPESWRISLDLIADNYSVYLTAMDDVKQNGILRVDSQNRTHRNMAVTVANVAQKNLTDLLKSFALTPMSKSKMKAFKADEETAEDYIDYLTDN